MSSQSRVIFTTLCLSVLCLVNGGVQPKRLVAYLSPPPVVVAQVPVAPLVRKKDDSKQAPELHAQAALLVDEHSGSILYAQNADTPLPPASTTKLMTALVAREVYPEGTVLTVPAVGSIGGAKVGLTRGTQYAVEQILEAALIPSGNDAAYTLAANMPGGVPAFVEKMNAKARELHLSTAEYRNPTGFDDPELRMSVRDLSILTREVLKDPFLKKVVSTQATTISDITGKRAQTIITTNHLLGIDPRVIGVKTGTTEEAGQVLVSAFASEGRVIVCIVMGSQDRYADTLALVNWAEATFEWVPFDQTMVY